VVTPFTLITNAQTKASAITPSPGLLSRRVTCKRNLFRRVDRGRWLSDQSRAIWRRNPSQLFWFSAQEDPV